MVNLKLSHTLSTDSDTLALLGKKQVLKRRFGFWSLFGFAVCELITWETVLALFSQSFNNGGPAGSVYGFLISWVSTLSVYTVVSELASLAPIAGGQYYWVYMLAPPRWKVFSSYIIGWLTSLAWVATVATESIFTGTILQGLVILDHPDSYAPKLWHGTLITWAVVAVAIFINVVTPGLLPKLEIGIIFLHLSAFVAVITTLWVLTPEKHTAHFVFATSMNEGHWPTQGLSYCVGFLGNVATFVGADASVHLAEETEDAARTIPRAIIASMCVNGAVGFVMMVTILFCLGDVESVLGTATGYPFIQIFANSVGNIAGATFMGAIVLVLTWMCSTGIITTASRMTWSFARDKGTPFSTFLTKVSPQNRIPVAALCTACFLACLLTLIYIGSSTAFNDVVSLTITGFYSSYFLPAAFLLHRRIKGTIAPYQKHSAFASVSAGVPAPATTASDTEPINTTTENHDNDHNHDHNHDPNHSHGLFASPSQDDNMPEYPNPEATSLKEEKATESTLLDTTHLTWGPFHLPGILGILNNAYACAYMIFVIFWSVWPPNFPATYENMNYSIVVTGGVVIFSMLWYWFVGHREYRGPTVDREVEEAVNSNVTQAAARRASSVAAATAVR